MFYDEWLKNGYLCSCKKQLQECTFWSASRPTRDFLMGAMNDPEYSDHSFLLFQGVQRNSGKDIIVDSSKSPYRLSKLLADPRFDVKVIHLVRNGLAVINSQNRSHARPGTENRVKTKAAPLLNGIYRWVQRNRFIGKLSKQMGTEEFLRVRYEDLCTQTEIEMRKICEYIGIDFEESMVNPLLDNIHNIGGSRWRFSDHPITIELDEKWTSELSWVSMQLFNLLGGWLNRKYGYPLETS